MLRVVAAAGDLGAKFRRFRIKTTDMAWINRATNLTGELEQGDFLGCIASTEALIEVGGSVAISMSRPGENGANAGVGRIGDVGLGGCGAIDRDLGLAGILLAALQQLFRGAFVLAGRKSRSSFMI